ncbi:hypothetical protein [Wolbachia endosymbiont of Dirofilaria (Dirofilaria) immitis]|uniref:hypothetical protein n=1 Tax=Wolbachia endosymbiont of Dirofilaria (Dirofilaria) immitis TaxID=1812115 RepID=UPI0015895CC1|nr:hypothetical protein [Wolbachia endosymbiont of Dirofilaria (Dirofilaria) immitis]QKX02249.1 hypothetical protein GOY12_01555 [Wolbachia endosymbiont of Dirofilaria (Dirofilaria) immitis]
MTDISTYSYINQSINVYNNRLIIFFYRNSLTINPNNIGAIITWHKMKEVAKIREIIEGS